MKLTPLDDLDIGDQVALTLDSGGRLQTLRGEFRGVIPDGGAWRIVLLSPLGIAEEVDTRMRPMIYRTGKRSCA